MKARWRSDVGYGFLVAAVGALVLAIALFFFPVAALWAIGLIALGAAISLFGGFEYFMTRGQV